MKDKKVALPVIQNLWIGDELSTMEKLSMVSFLENSHPYHLYVYKDIKGVPDNVVLKDASRIVHPNKIFKYKNHDSYAGFSDIFRYQLLLEKGGWWVDTDVICLAPFNFNQEYVFAQEAYNDKFKNIEINKIASCVIKTPKKSKIMDYCYNESTSKDTNKLKWGEIGPNLLTKAVSKFGLQNYVTNTKAFCPVPWTHFLALISDKLDNEAINKILKKSHAIHLWNELWRQNKIDKNGNYPPNSIFELLKKRYLDV